MFPLKSLRSFSLWRKIHFLLHKELLSGYSNTSVQGGFGPVIERILKEEWFVGEYPSSLRKEISESSSEYQLNPSSVTYEKLVSSIGQLQDYWDNQIATDVVHDALLQPIQYCKGFGPKRASLFGKLGIQKLHDLLYYFPKNWNDQSKTCSIRDTYLQLNQTVSVVGKVASVSGKKVRAFRISTITIMDPSGMMQLVFVNQKYVEEMFQKMVGRKVLVVGKVQYKYGNYQMSSPEFEVISSSSKLKELLRIQPVYGLTDGLSQKVCRKLIKETLEKSIVYVSEFLPSTIRKKEGLMHRAEAVCNLHYPLSIENKELARRRIVFDEFLLNQYQLLQYKNLHKKRNGLCYHIPEQMISDFYSLLSFQVTSDQKHSILEIVADLTSGYPMNRLLHGDVGSGKTTVAMAFVYFTVRNNYQIAFMAPTEILARQLYSVLKKTLSKENIQGNLLISDLSSKEKETVKGQLKSGDIGYIVGTHALLEEDVEILHPGAFIIDEQHRFGVEQRKRLFSKTVNPHVLVMSATPIPRTMALTRFGDLDISTIKQLPNGEKNIITRIVADTDRTHMNSILHEVLGRHEKIYVVCPLIEESDKINVANSIEMQKRIEQDFTDASVFLLHGKMKAEEKNKIMNQFIQTDASILVSTTVIEVGIDVPDATAIVIENAERFGLAQLHQLRGRVGRKSQTSYCFLTTGQNFVSKRLDVLEETNSGFTVAEKDLALRGPGELFGKMQSGFLFSSLVSLETDYPLLEKAKRIAQEQTTNPSVSNAIEKELEFRSKKLNL